MRVGRRCASSAQLGAAKPRVHAVSARAHAASAPPNNGVVAARQEAPPGTWKGADTPGVWNEDRKKYSQQFAVRGYEVSPNQKASMVTMTNLLQEIAANHAVGMWGRGDKGFAGLPDAPDIVFVMTRLQVRMHAYPRWGAALGVTTYFADEGRLSARRDWTVGDAATGAPLGVATSNWVNINMATRRLTKLPDDIRAQLLTHAVPKDTVVLPASECKRKLPELDEASASTGSTQIARRSDMDMNGHINNVVYVAWALEAVPADLYDDAGCWSLYEIEADYKSECTAGETVCSVVQELQPGAGGQRIFLHSLRRVDTESGKVTELVRARTTWVAGP
ncbi:hypothetical protein FOA52_003730 [Chlamydomonas sp. UWO 241]|nr:hypothetical protein FOA52_003730 [Chlamydomonas sp. UWO 241]